MKKNLIIILIIALVLSLIYITYRYLYVPKTIINYDKSNKKLQGPSRGFYIQIDSGEIERLKKVREDGFKIVLVAYDIKEYLNKTISDEKLKELSLLLEEANSLELEVIFRPAYGFTSDYRDPYNIEVILGHIKQISKIINKQADIILCVQAGFVGPWGEWHSSKFLSGDKEETEFRNQLIKTMIEEYTESIKINLRKPQFIIEAEEAGLNIKRLGFHNDGLLASDTDLGTYTSERPDSLVWARKNISHGVNGGEMPVLSTWTDIDTAVTEFKQIGITYLNRMYKKEIFNKWKISEYEGQNAYTYVEKYIGYRLALEKIILPEKINPRRTFTLKLTIENVGFAPIRDNYCLYLIAVQGNIVVLNELISDNISELLSNDSNVYKSKSHLDYDVLFESDLDISFGVYLSNKKSSIDYQGLKFDDLPTNTGNVELGNKDVKYDKGINFLFDYIKIEDQYVLDK